MQHQVKCEDEHERRIKILRHIKSVPQISSELYRNLKLFHFWYLVDQQ